MSVDDDYYCGLMDGTSSSQHHLHHHHHHHHHRMSQPAFHTRLLHSTTSLQVCYVNDEAASFERELGGTQKQLTKPDIIPKSISEASTLAAIANSKSSPTASVGPPSMQEDFFTKQARLQAEAKLALAQVRPMAHMQLQLEKEMRKKSPLSENVVGIPGFVDGKMRQLNRQLLKRMNIAQLQVVVNDLHTQIEALNADLMQQLVDRDDLHMAQDSMLVDIDDLTRRAQEFAAKVNKQAVNSHHK